MNDHTLLCIVTYVFPTLGIVRTDTKETLKPKIHEIFKHHEDLKPHESLYSYTSIILYKCLKINDNKINSSSLVFFVNSTH